MLIPAKITNKYVVIKEKAVRTLEIAVKGSLELNIGDSIMLNPQNPSVLEIKRARPLSTVYPYPDA